MEIASLPIRLPTAARARTAHPRGLRVLLVHNRYQQPGGEDVVFEAEVALLEAHGHEVVRYEIHNDAVEEMGRLRLAGRTVWSAEVYAAIGEFVRRSRAEVVHFHNTLPLVSPAAYYAARRAGAAVVQTLHNYRLVCPGALLLRDGAPCEACVGRPVAWAAVRHACYRGSPVASAAVAAMTAAHRAGGTWRRAVDRYIALTPAARDVFIRGGLPAERVVVKPNFLAADPGPGPGGGGYALFVGRLSPEKGIRPLLEAWRADPALPPLKVVGEGLMAGDVATEAERDARITWLGGRTHAEVLALMRRADVLVCPSLAYEGMPMVVVEAFACGLPVAASAHGAAGQMVETGVSGALFNARVPATLARTVRDLLASPPALARLRRGARRMFKAHYTAERNHVQLLEIYRDALSTRRGEPAATSGSAG